MLKESSFFNKHFFSCRNSQFKSNFVICIIVPSCTAVLTFIYGQGNFYCIMNILSPTRHHSYCINPMKCPRGVAVCIRGRGGGWGWHYLIIWGLKRRNQLFLHNSNIKHYQGERMYFQLKILLSSLYLTPFSKGAILCGKNLLLWQQILSFKSRSHIRELPHLEKQAGINLTLG